MTPSPAGVRVGVDIGGTFTDIAVIDPASLAVNEAETRALRAGPPAAPGHRRP